MLALEGYPSLSIGYETDDDDADAIFAGITFEEVGPGSVSLGMLQQIYLLMISISMNFHTHTH